MSDADQGLDMEEAQDNETTHQKNSPIEPQVPVRKGQILKNVRIEKGLSLEAVHESTKIPMDALKAIEEGYTIRTLSPFYIKGFLKIYAGYLNIDITEIIEDYQKKEELPKVNKQVVDTDFEFNIKQTLKKYLTHQRKKQLAALIGIFLVLFVFFKIIVFLSQSFRSKPKKQIVKQEKVVQKSISGPEINKFENNISGADIKPIVEKPVVAAAVTPIPQPKPKAEITAKPQPAAAIAVAQPVQKDITLTIRALKDSWLRVKADEKTVFQSTLNKGSVETWQADKEIVISGKNIINLEFELNGKLIGTLGRKNRKAKSITITKDGLSVTK